MADATSPDRPAGTAHPATVDTAGPAQAEVVDLLTALLRIDTSNPTHPERPAAEWVAEQLAEVGLEPRIIEAAPGRASTVARLEGEDPSRPPLLIHGHLDVVPADASEWSVDPFAGEVRDGYVWGRGAVDMKDMDAMTLALVRSWRRAGRRPPRDVVLAFVSDEEAGGRQGAHHLVDHHPDLFADCTEAISEVGGFSVALADPDVLARAGDLRLYAIQTAEKGLGWLRLRAEGRPGHGSMVHDDNAVTRLAAAVSRIGAHEFPLQMTDAVRTLLEQINDLTGLDIDVDHPEPDLPKLGGIARMIGATLRNTANPTILEAGYKANVIPGLAEAVIDTRFLPGREDELLATIDELVGPGITRSWDARDIAVETTFDGALVDHMAACLRAEDPGAHALPYTTSAGTDAKSFSTLGIRCFGFAPLRLPPDLDFAALFHGIDERVPVDALQFGVRVLDRFLAGC